jgi:hypothetical protein
MGWTQADVDGLKAAIAKGTRRVSFADRMVEYESTASLLQALTLAQAEVNAAAGVARPRQFLAYESGKGL